MIYYMVIYTCLIIGPNQVTDCRPHIENAMKIHLGACSFWGPQAMAQYQVEHPKRRPMAWKCTDRPERYIKANEA